MNEASHGLEMSELLPLLEGRLEADAAFLCQGGTCRLPATEPQELGLQLGP